MTYEYEYTTAFILVTITIFFKVTEEFWANKFYSLVYGCDLITSKEFSTRFKKPKMMIKESKRSFLISNEGLQFYRTHQNEYFFLAENKNSLKNVKKVIDCTDQIDLNYGEFLDDSYYSKPVLRFFLYLVDTTFGVLDWKEPNESLIRILYMIRDQSEINIAYWNEGTIVTYPKRIFNKTFVKGFVEGEKPKEREYHLYEDDPEGNKKTKKDMQNTVDAENKLVFNNYKRAYLRKLRRKILDMKWMKGIKLFFTWTPCWYFPFPILGNILTIFGLFCLYFAFEKQIEKIPDYSTNNDIDRGTNGNTVIPTNNDIDRGTNRSTVIPTNNDIERGTNRNTVSPSKIASKTEPEEEIFNLLLIEGRCLSSIPYFREEEDVSSLKSLMESRPSKYTFIRCFYEVMDNKSKVTISNSKLSAMISVLKCCGVSERKFYKILATGKIRGFDFYNFIKKYSYIKNRGIKVFFLAMGKYYVCYQVGSHKYCLNLLLEGEMNKSHGWSVKGIDSELYQEIKKNCYNDGRVCKFLLDKHILIS